VVYTESHVQERWDFMTNTMLRRVNYTLIQTEKKAREKLISMLSEDQKRTLYLCDQFMEYGRSGVTYLLRKNRPTVAWRNKRPLCALCLHPMAFYTGSWAGILSPSDELMAHLKMIRADEHYFWRKANQIPFIEPNSGI
jgi:hypothetical protein